MDENKKQEIEATQAVNAVTQADKNVEQIKAEKAAKKAKKHEERLAKHPKLGKVINWCDDNKGKVALGVATGGATFALGWFGHKFWSEKKAEQDTVDVVVDLTTTDTPEPTDNSEA